MMVESLREVKKRHKKIVQKRRKKAVEQELFTEEEMRGGISDDVGDVFVDAYLEAIRIISRLDDEEFFTLSKQYQQLPNDPERLFFLPALPTHIMNIIQYVILGECIELRHHQEYFHDCPGQRDILIINCFEEARERFEKENENGEYKYTSWLRKFEIVQ